MKIVDIIILMLIFSAGLTGAKNGFFKQTVMLVGTILCFLLAYLFKNPIANFLSYNLPFFKFKGSIEGLTSLNIVLYQLVAFLLIFIFLIAVLVVLVKITNVFEKILRFTIVLGIPSKILGFILGVLEGYVVVFVLLFALKQPALNFKKLEDSKIAPIVVNSSPGLSNVVSKTNKAMKDIYGVIKNYNKEEADIVNEEIIDILLDYKVIDKNYLKTLNEKGKIVYTKE